MEPNEELEKMLMKIEITKTFNQIIKIVFFGFAITFFITKNIKLQGASLIALILSIALIIYIGKKTEEMAMRFEKRLKEILKEELDEIFRRTRRDN